MSSKAPPIFAMNPLAGLSVQERNQALQEINSNSNSTTPSSSFLVQREKSVGPRNAVFAVNPLASPETKAYMAEKERAYRKSKLPVYTPSPTAIAFKQAVLNRIKAKRNAERTSKYPPIRAVNPYPGINISDLFASNSNSNTPVAKPQKGVTFAAGTKQRKVSRKQRKNRKNWKTRRTSH